MANYNEAKKTILSNEANMSNNKYDRGGLTNKGITYSLWCKYFGANRMFAFERMDDEHWDMIVQKEFWNKIHGNEIKNQSVATMIFDYVFNSGMIVIKKIQYLVKVPMDGIVGDKTVLAINSAIQRNLFDDIMLIRRKYYADIIKNRPSQKVFAKGWNNRLNKIKYNE